MTRVRRTILWAVLAAAAVLLARVAQELVVWYPEAARLQVTSLADFERELAAMREPLEIPGMSAAIAERGEIVWIYHLASTDSVEDGASAITPMSSGRPWQRSF